MFAVARFAIGPVQIFMVEFNDSGDHAGAVGRDFPNPFQSAVIRGGNNGVGECALIWP